MMNQSTIRVQNATHAMEKFLFNMLGDVMQRAQRVPGLNTYAMVTIMILIVLILIINLFKDFLPPRTHAAQRDVT